MFLASKFFLKAPLEILDQPRSDHCAKFHADWPTRLSDLA